MWWRTRNTICVEVEKLLEELEVDKSQVVKVRRIKNRAGVTSSQQIRPGVVVVELDSSAAQAKALSNARHLKQSVPFRQVYVNKDRTTAQRLFDKKLRAERDLLNNQLDKPQTVNGVQRKYGKHKGRPFFGTKRGDLLSRVYIRDKAWNRFKINAGGKLWILFKLYYEK